MCLQMPTHLCFGVQVFDTLTQPNHCHNINHIQVVSSCKFLPFPLHTWCMKSSNQEKKGRLNPDRVLELKKKYGMQEQDAQQLAPHKVIPGNRPSNTLLLHKLDPHTLGYLTSIYEHSVYIQSVIWNINAFDQWGVELGKKLSAPIFDSLTASNTTTSFDSSTNNLVTICKAWQKTEPPRIGWKMRQHNKI